MTEVYCHVIDHHHEDGNPSSANSFHPGDGFAPAGVGNRLVATLAATRTATPLQNSTKSTPKPNGTKADPAVTGSALLLLALEIDFLPRWRPKMQAIITLCGHTTKKHSCQPPANPSCNLALPLRSDDALPYRGCRCLNGSSVSRPDRAALKARSQ